MRSARRIVPIVMELIRPKSVIDVGCGHGAWLAMFRENEVLDLLGIDGTHIDIERTLIPPESFMPMNLNAPVPINRRFDLAVSLEVGEHLPSESAVAFVRFLTSVTDIVLFSAAIPGQGGTHHVNEQPPAYWAQLFADRGFVCADVLRHQIWDDPDVAPYYAQNMLLYIKAEQLQRYAIANTAIVSSPLHFIHPKHYRDSIGNRSSIDLIKELLRRTIGCRR